MTTTTRIPAQLIRFVVVGGIGYVVNLAVFAALVHGAGAPIAVAATAAFLVAVANNFVLNRRWTFGIRHDEDRARQASRFLALSVAVFLVSLGVLSLLVAAGVAKVPAQAISIIVGTPLNFLGNRIWTFV